MLTDTHELPAPATLAARIGTDRVLVEAVELHTGAMIESVSVVANGIATGVTVTADERAELEASFVAACRAARTPSADRGRVRKAGPVAHTRPRVSRPGRHM